MTQDVGLFNGGISRMVFVDLCVISGLYHVQSIVPNEMST